MNPEQRFTRLIQEPDTIFCRECHGGMVYAGDGVYKCSLCGWRYTSKFGTVKHYLEEHGPSPALQISEGTGVSKKRIDGFVEERRLERVYRKK